MEHFEDGTIPYHNDRIWEYGIKSESARREGMLESLELRKRDEGVARRRHNIRVVGLRRDNGTL